MFASRKIFRLSFIGKTNNNNIDQVNFAPFRCKLIRMASETTRNAARNATLIGIAQMRATNNKVSNMHQVEQLVAKAKSQDAKMLFLPECCDYVGENRTQTLELSEPLTGPTMKRYQELAKNNQIWLSLGGVHESKSCGQKPTEKVYNAHVLLNDEGEIVDIYRKLHLFDVDTPEFKFRESTVVVPGDSLRQPCKTPIGNLALQICYDVRFPETSVLLRKWGAQLLTYPSAFAYNTGKAHWEILLRGRAIENQCFVIAPAQVGYHNEKRRSWGHAMVVDPWGKILADCGGENDLDVAIAEINMDTLENVRKNMPCFEHRRGEIYSLTAFESGNIESPLDRSFATNTIRHETIFYETEHSFAFTNLRCVVDGHVLVATKRIAPRLSALQCEEMTDLFATVCKIQRMLESYYKTTAATVTVQDGSDAGQTVPHVHFHVMPRRPGDFGHNDQIYVKLEDRCENKPDRTLEERIEEAQRYRDFLLSDFKYN